MLHITLITFTAFKKNGNLMPNEVFVADIKFQDIIQEEGEVCVLSDETEAEYQKQKYFKKIECFKV